MLSVYVFAQYIEEEPRLSVLSVSETKLVFMATDARLDKAVLAPVDAVKYVFVSKLNVPAALIFTNGVPDA